MVWNTDGQAVHMQIDWLLYIMLQFLISTMSSHIVCQVVDVDRLFTNMETVCEVSAALLNRMHMAMSDPDPEAVVIGTSFIVPDSFFLPFIVDC